MAEGAIVSAVLRVLHETIGSPLIKDFGLIWGVNGELLKLKSTLTTIEAVLADAEERRVKELALNDWLKKLRNVAYQADNVLDDFRIEALRREAETGNHFLKKLVFKIRMGHKLKEVGDKLVSIAEERKKFHLSVVDTPARTGERETFSFIDDPVIFGREGDKEKIVNFLMTNIPHDEDVVSVIAIVGMGGLGKTTLAKLAYNDIVVKDAFDLRMWVCVSEDFDVKRLIKLIVESESGNEAMEQLQHRLQEKISGKKFLLVLDDVWNENVSKWETLRGLLRIGAKGSKIVVTTRIEGIASMMGAANHHNLKKLSEDDCWALFETRAFKGKRKEDYPELVSIGKEIVRKCDGLPLAAKTLGSLMLSRKTQIEWEAIRDNETWQLREDESGILPGLMLSYYDLPSHLKPCFVYCALFPKDSRITENTFIWLWMAEGLIPSGSHGCPRDIGKRYLNELVSRSLFQSDDSNIYYVHDLVHDLAKYVARDEFFTVPAGESIDVRQFCHCLTVIGNLNTTILKKFCQTETLRTLIILKTQWIKEVTREMFFSLSKLRALYWKHCELTDLPDSIGSLKHLRYINLSDGHFRVLPQSICSLRNLQVLLLSSCTELESLPSSIGALQNLNALQLDGCRNIKTLPESMMRLQKLEYLSLAGCGRLQELPKGLSNMRNLRNLDISDCDKLTHMPAEMGKLNSLEKLSTFIVDEERGCSIAELQHLINLGGKLKIKNLGKLKDPRAARQANMKEKHNMQSLALYSYEGVIDEQVLEGLEAPQNIVELAIKRDMRSLARYGVIDDEVLEGLEASQNIVRLAMEGGTELPGWLKTITESSFPKLIEVRLYKFKGCKLLPALGQLQHLQTLEIDGMGSIEVIGREFCGSNRDAAFPSLKSIVFWNLPKWKKWLSSSSSEEEEDEEDGIIEQQALAFPCLKELEISNCPELTSLPRLPSLQMLTVQKSMKLLKSAGSLRGNGSLKRLNIWGEVEEDVGVLEGLQDLSSVEVLDLWRIDDLDSVMDRMRHLFSTVLTLQIFGCNKIRVLPETMRSLVSLQSLTISHCNRLSSLGEGLRGLTALRKLFINGCKELGCMPEYMGSLTSLQSLTIWNCPDLKRRCEREKGEDWHLISHIPNIYIDPPQPISPINYVWDPNNVQK